MDLDFDEDPEVPDYVVDRLLERQTVNVLSGDTGAGKSLLMASLAVALCTEGDEWLGRELRGARVLYVDEENPSRLVKARLRALGLTNEHRERLRYFSRQGFLVGEERWTKELQAAVDEHRPDLIVIDTAGAATAADVNDNDAVTRLFTQALRPIATGSNAALVVLHHERKPQQGQSKAPGQAMMGARQWAGQADTHVAIRCSSELAEEPIRPGVRGLRREFVMQTPKVRDGEPDIPSLVVVISEKGEGNRLLTMSVVDGGRYEREPSKQDASAGRIAALLRERGPMKHGAISAALEQRGGTFDRALEIAVASGAVVQDKARGPYRAVDQEPDL